MILALAVGFSAAVSARAASIDLSSGSQLLSALIANNGKGGAFVGNLTFDNFTYSPVGVAPDASQVYVSPFVLGSETGVAFNAGVPWSNGDWGISFTVTSNGGLITNDYLAVAGNAPGNSSWQVDETIAWEGASLFIRESSNTVTPGDPVIGSFAGVSSLSIFKDINVSAGADVTLIQQGFAVTSVPVPAAVWTGLGTLACVAGMAMLRRRQLA
jgi:hypothetical protein